MSPEAEWKGSCGHPTKDGACAVMNCQTHKSMSQKEEKKCSNCQDIHHGSIIHVDNEGKCVKCGRGVGHSTPTDKSGWAEEIRKYAEENIADEKFSRLWFIGHATALLKGLSLSDTQGYERRKAEETDVLQKLLDRYVGLVNSGDAGFWDCETEEEVINARKFLSQVRDTINRKLQK